MTETLTFFAKSLIAMLPRFINKVNISKDELNINVSPTDLIKIMLFLRDHTNCQFKLLMDITAVDYPERKKRFEVVYNLLSVRHNARIRVKVFTDETTPVPSLTSIFRGANWFEREVWDLFGIFFSNHPDLRRILTDYGFEGYPLRKDFPLSGYVEVRYADDQKRVIIEPLEITQEFRQFDFKSPWDYYVK